MTNEEFRKNIELKKEMEFTYRDTHFAISYGTDEKGPYISFGEFHQLPQKYYSFGELMNEAKVINSYMKYAVPSLNFL